VSQHKENVFLGLYASLRGSVVKFSLTVEVQKIGFHGDGGEVGIEEDGTSHSIQSVLVVERTSTLSE
jgi:hypothetical protein